jgi:hypothetical protein
MIRVRVDYSPHGHNPNTEESGIDDKSFVVGVEKGNPDPDSQRRAECNDRADALEESDIAIWRGFYTIRNRRTKSPIDQYRQNTP